MQPRKDIRRMFLKSLFIILIGFLAGTGISAGTFAFLLVIGVVPRMIRTANLNNKIILLENVIIAGIMTGTFLSFWKQEMLLGMFSRLFFICFGAGAGVFVGCIAVALAEILDTFPIIFRRMKLHDGLEEVMFAMAFGKLAGSFFYFLYGYGIM